MPITNKEKQKIVFCMSSFRVGGGERMMVDIANEFSKRGHDVDLLVLSSIGEYKDQVDSTIRVVAINARRMFFSLPWLISYIKKEKPKIALTLDEHVSIYMLIARLLSGAQTKIVLRVGTTYSKLFLSYKDFKNKHRFWLMKWLYKRADRVIAVSKGVADDIVSFADIPPGRVFTIYNPKNLSLIEEMSRAKTGHEWLDKKSLPVIIAVGRFRHPPKNYGLLIRAFNEVRKIIPVRLILVGKGRDIDFLRDLVLNLGCENHVVFPGYTDNPYVWMSKADIFVSPSLWEGMPNALLEAMACGLPVISSDCDSGPREILAPDTDYKFRLKSGVEYAKYGVLCAVNDEAALTEAITKLLKDSALRAKYASLSLERIKDFDSKKIIDEYEKVIAGLNS